MAGWKSTLPLLGPALLLAVAGLIWWGGPSTSSPEQPAARKELWEEVDFASLQPGGTLPDWEIMQGAFQLVAREGRTMLEMGPEPMVEGKVRWSRVLTGGGGVRARMKGDRARRAAPRFCVSLLGDSEVQLRAAPLKDVLEIAVPGAPERVLVSMPWKWRPEQWLWLEFRVSPRATAEGTPGSLFEGRVWADDEDRPPSPSIQYEFPAPPGLPRALVEGAPYALRPIYYDRIGTLRFHR